MLADTIAHLVEHVEPDRIRLPAIGVGDPPPLLHMVFHDRRTSRRGIVPGGGGVSESASSPNDNYMTNLFSFENVTILPVPERNPNLKSNFLLNPHGIGCSGPAF
jgi:hypothetical protein